MKAKVRGFTLIELIITLSLTVVVLGVVYTFFFVNNKNAANIQINSELQTESENIQKEFIFSGTQSERIVNLNGNIMGSTNDISYSTLTNGKYNITDRIVFKSRDDLGEVIEYRFILSSNKLSMEEWNIGTNKKIIEKNISNNVEDFYIRPLDYLSKPSGSFYNTDGIEINLVLNKKKGYSDATIPVSVIVKFRNK